MLNSFLFAAILLCSDPSFIGDEATDALLEFPVDRNSRGSFVENRGQWTHAASFVGRVDGAHVLVEPGTLVLRLDGDGPTDFARAVVRLEVEDALPDVRPTGVHRLEGVHHYFLGPDPERWRVNVPHFAAVLQPEVRPGVDLLVRRIRGRIEMDLALQPGCDLRSLAFRCIGADRLEIGQDGSLVVTAGEAQLALSAPIAWTVQADGSREPVTCVYRLLDGMRFQLAAPDRDPCALLVVDPELVWSSYLGGSSWESAYGVDVDENGAVTVVGQTGSQNFPTTPGAFDTTYNGPASSDVFVTRVAPNGALLWSTFVGGSSGEEGCAVDVDANGIVTVVGVTSSSGFPTTPGAFDSSLSGFSDAFVLRLSAAGDALLSSTLLGGSAGDLARGVVALEGGDSMVVGTTDSGNFPATPGAFATASSGGSDAFVARVSADGTTLVAATYLGGSAGETGEGIAVSASGTVVVVGSTSSASFPTTPGAFDTQLDGNSDAFVSWLSSDLSSLVASTLLGGASGDTPKAVAIAANGEAIVVGTTNSSDFPTTPGAFKTQLDGSSDVFVTRLASDASSLAFSTLIGGAGGEVAFGVGLDASEAPILGGVTSSANFPVTNDAFQAAADGNSDAFLVRLAADGSAVLYATYFGGGAGDVGEAADANSSGFAAVAGTTSSTDFPLLHPFDPTYSSPSEAFVALFDLSEPDNACSMYCFGDGSGNACPCGNTGASDSGCANSVGTGATLTCTGSASIGADDLVLVATGLVPGQPLLFFQGDNRVAGGAGAAFGDGLRCAGGGVRRLQVLSASTLGEASSSASLVNAGGATAGAVLRYQGWYRDPVGSPCGNTFNLTNGLEVPWVQ